jgi:hypothetical protein
VKTVSMPLAEYEKEINDLKSQLELKSYKRGFYELAQLIRTSIFNGVTYKKFHDPELKEIFETLIDDLKKRPVLELEEGT